jgi:DNA-binding SARP family transcriptional activator
LYDDRFRLLREHLRSVHLDIVSQLSELYLREGRHAEVVTLNQRALRLDPYDEKAHGRPHRVVQRSGSAHMALRQYDTCRTVLWEELGLEPSDELQRLRATV